MSQNIGLHRQICQALGWSRRSLVDAAVLFLLLISAAVPRTAGSTLRQIESGRIEQHVRTLAEMGSRVTGYPGAVAAADYVEEQLRLYGVEEMYRRPFQVPIPLDRGAGLVLLDSGRELELNHMWPNLVRTSTLPQEGIEGDVVYGGRAGWEEVDGLELEGNIVVLEYNCGMDWIKVFDLGAAAVIFLAPQQTHRKEGEHKFLATPADLPRFYAPEESARILRPQLARQKGRLRARLWGQMDWEAPQAETLVGIIPGAEQGLHEQAVLVGAYYDAISPVPARAPGAEQACGMAAWLELARLLALEKPARTVVLVATAGHFQGMAGMRDLVAGWRQKDPAQPLEGVERRLRDFEIAYYLGLDLSSQTDRLCLVRAGSPYRVRTIEPPIYDRITRFAEEYEAAFLDGRMILGGELNPRRQRRLVGRLPERIPVEGAVVNLAGYLGLTLVSAGDDRSAFDSPLDLPEQVNIQNLAVQVRFLSGLVRTLLDDPEAGPQIEERKDSFGVLRGQVLSWGAQSYAPDQPVENALVRVRSLHKTMMGVRLDLMTTSDSTGHFVLQGLEARTLYLQPAQMEVYGLNPDNGAVEFAVDRGPYGAQQYPLETLMDRLDEEIVLVGFFCRSITLFDLFDPRYLFTLDHLQLLDAGQEAALLNYGFSLPPTPREAGRYHSYYSTVGADVEKVAVALVPAGSTVKMTMSTGLYGLGRRLLLLNSSAGQPQGKGFEAASSPRIGYSAWQIARDTFLLNGARLQELETHGVHSGLLRSLHLRAEDLLQRAEEALAARRYSAFVDLSRQAWGIAARTYGSIQNLVVDVVNGVLFFLVMLVPFAYFGERLCFGSADVRRQVAGVALVFAAGFLILRYVHPAFELSIYPLLILLGFLILTLSLVVAALGLSRLHAQLHAVLAPRIALHRADTRRSGMFFQALFLGVAQMRRRPWRTGLTCATLVLLCFSMLSFTTVRSALRFNQTPIGSGAGRDGLLLRLPGFEGMEENVYQHLRLRFGAERTVGRAWYLWPGIVEGAAGKRARADAALGLMPAEERLSGVELKAGRFFAPGERRVCILSDVQAAALGLQEEDMGRASVVFLGADYLVIGIADSQAFDALKDINGAPLVPLDREAQQPAEERAGRGRAGVEPAFVHMGSAYLLLLPYETVRQWGERSRLASVAILFDDKAQALAQIRDFTRILGLNAFAALDGQRYLINAVGVQSFSGPRGLWVPILIAALIVFNTMMGSVYERLSEIGTLNAIGLAPVHVTAFFLAEAGVYANLSGVLGYLVGQFMAKLGWIYGMFPGLMVNYSSLAAIATIAGVMLVVLLAAAYPARKAAQICQPGIERNWRLPAPSGDFLQVPMPFTLERDDARGLVAFLAEYLEAYNEQSIGAGFYAESLRSDHAASSASVEARLWLAPFDQGLSQNLAIRVEAEGDSRFCSISLHIERISGDGAAWIRGNRIFINDLRKQFLVWRALQPADRADYAREGA
jgi:hypothetical protein